MNQIRIGAPHFISVRPLVYGFTHNVTPHVELVYGEPAMLADALERGRLDAALIPSIEYLRGVGRFVVEGPALLARPAPGSPP